MLLGWEIGFHGGISLGRADQYLYPFYKKDIEKGILTKEKAQELIDCWFMRFSQSFVLWSQKCPNKKNNPCNQKYISFFFLPFSFNFCSQIK